MEKVPHVSKLKKHHLVGGMLIAEGRTEPSSEDFVGPLADKGLGIQGPFRTLLCICALCGTLHVPGAAAQRNLDRLEKWANRSLMEFLPLGGSNLMQQYKQGTDRWKSSFVETLRVRVDHKLSSS